MDIEIPDLDDIEFVRACPQCQGSLKCVEWDSTAGPLVGKHQRPTGGPVEKPCMNCAFGAHGNLPSGVVPTRAGETLIDFLTQLGVLDNHTKLPRR